MADPTTLQLKGTIVSKDSPEYNSAIQRVSHFSIRYPAHVAFPSSADDVSQLIRFANAHSIELAVKGGGANTADISSTDGGLVIDLSRMKNVEVSQDRQTVTVQGGANWGDVYEALAKYGLDAVGGSAWCVGVGGFLTGGGHSNYSGIWGMGCDNIIAATVALADGSIVKANSENNSDLFWAIRGGMGKFGIVLEFVLRVYPTLGAVNGGFMIIPSTSFDQAVEALQDTLQRLNTEDKINVYFMRAPPEFHPCISIVPIIPGSPDRAASVLSPLAQLAVFSDVQPVPNQFTLSHGIDSVLNKFPQRMFIAGSSLQDIGGGKGVDTKLFGDVWQRWVQWTEANDSSKETMIFWELQLAGIMKAKHDEADSNAFRRRDSLSYVVVGGRSRTEEFDEEMIRWSKETTSIIRVTQPDGGVFPNIALYDETAEELFGQENAKKLRSIKLKYDPNDVWRKGYKL